MKCRKHLTEHEINAITKLVVESNNWSSAPFSARKPETDWPPHPPHLHIPQDDMKRFREAALALWKKYGIDVHFSDHFLKRVNAARNDPPITAAELTRIFRESARYHGERIYDTPARSGTLHDIVSDISVMLAIPELQQPIPDTDTNGKRLTRSQRPKRKLTISSIMRKSNFKQNKDDEIYKIGNNPEDNYYREPGTLERIPVSRR